MAQCERRRLGLVIWLRFAIISFVGSGDGLGVEHGRGGVCMAMLSQHCRRRSHLIEIPGRSGRPSILILLHHCRLLKERQAFKVYSPRPPLAQHWPSSHQPLPGLIAPCPFSLRPSQSPSPSLQTSFDPFDLLDPDPHP